MALVLQDAFSGSGLGGWTVSNMTETGGVMKPTAYGTEAIAIWNTVSSTADMRCKFVLGGTAIRDFGIFLRKADTVASTAADHYLVRFNVGGTSATEAFPAWNVPDTLQAQKTLSAVTTEKTPTSTPSQLLTPFVGNTVSLRDNRLRAGTTITCIIADDQLIVLVDDDPVYHESISGLDAVGYMGIIHYADATADTTFDDWETSTIVPRYVTKDAAASNSNDGSDPTTNAWATIPKGMDVQATNEILFVGTGTYEENIVMYDLLGASEVPRVPAAMDDFISIWALADATVLVSRNIPFVARSETKYLISHRISYEQWAETAEQPPINGTAGGGATGMTFASFVGGSVKHAWGNGIGIFSGTDRVGNNLIQDMDLQGNGAKTGSSRHNIYISGRDNRIRWNKIRGASTHPTWGARTTQGYGIHAFYSGSSNVGNNNTVVRYNTTHDHTNSAAGGIIISHGTGMIVEGNTAYDNTAGITLRYEKITGAVCKNNLSYENTAMGIYVDNSSACLIYNNTCADNGTYGIFAGANSLNDVAENNLCVNNTTDDIATHASATGFTETNNWETGDGDPLFQDATLDDYRITTSSPAKTGGTDLYTSDGVVTDMIGVIRPQGATQSYGAYESISLSNPPVNVLPGAVNVLTDTLKRIVVSATDADSDIVSTELTVDHGTLAVTTTGTVS